MEESNSESAHGALKSPDDSSDLIYEHAAHGSIYTIKEMPDEFDLRSHTLPSRDQGPRGTCAAFTAAAIKEIQENRDNGFRGYTSPEFIYYHRVNKPASGMYGRNVFQILQKIGSVPDSDYEYLDDESARKPSKKLYEQAALSRIANFARVITPEGLKLALLELGPCFLLLPLYRTRPEFWRAADGEKCRKGHAVAVVGYNTTGFILKNSWGSDWNGDGCIIIPYDDWGVQWECWVSMDAIAERQLTHRDKAKRKKEFCTIL